MKALNNFLFGGAGATTRMGDFGLFILRAGFGLTTARSECPSSSSAACAP